MQRSPFPAIVIVASLLAGLGTLAVAQQDKYAVKVLGGSAFSQFRGYEAWQLAVLKISNGER